MVWWFDDRIAYIRVNSGRNYLESEVLVVWISKSAGGSRFSLTRGTPADVQLSGPGGPGFTSYLTTSTIVFLVQSSSPRIRPDQAASCLQPVALKHALNQLNNDVFLTETKGSSTIKWWRQRCRVHGRLMVHISGLSTGSCCVPITENNGFLV